MGDETAISGVYIKLIQKERELKVKLLLETKDKDEITNLDKKWIQDRLDVRDYGISYDLLHSKLINSKLLNNLQSIKIGNIKLFDNKFVSLIGTSKGVSIPFVYHHYNVLVLSTYGNSIVAHVSCLSKRSWFDLETMESIDIFMPDGFIHSFEFYSIKNI